MTCSGLGQNGLYRVPNTRRPAAAVVAPLAPLSRRCETRGACAKRTAYTRRSRLASINRILQNIKSCRLFNTCNARILQNRAMPESSTTGQCPNPPQPGNARILQNRTMPESSKTLPPQASREAFQASREASRPKLKEALITSYNA